MNHRIPLAIPFLPGNESRYVQQALDEGMVSSVGRFVQEFEERFADYVGTTHAVACSSGTAALHLAMVALGITDGDRLVCSDFTFIASANAAIYQGASVTLIDSDYETWNMSPAHLLHTLDSETPALMEIVHILGLPADPALFQLADDYHIPVVEDAAEALGAEIEVAGAWRKVGSIGRAGAFSFNGNKLITTGGGGMVTTNDEELASLVRHLSTQAKVPGMGYLHDRVGFNYRMTNLAAGLGLGQLEQIELILARKREIADRYDMAFDGLADLTPSPPWSRPSRWLYSMCVGPSGGGSETRDQLLRTLNDEGIEARPLWRPLHLQPPFAAANLVGDEVGSDLFARGISLPCSPQLTLADQRFVVETALKEIG